MKYIFASLHDMEWHYEWLLMAFFLLVKHNCINRPRTKNTKNSIIAWQNILKNDIVSINRADQGGMGLTIEPCSKILFAHLYRMYNAKENAVHLQLSHNLTNPLINRIFGLTCLPVSMCKLWLFKYYYIELHYSNRLDIQWIFVHNILYSP